jgi:hypothetical protein
MMSDPKTAAQINLEHGGFINAETERVVDYFENEIFNAVEKLKHKRRLKKSSKYKPKREN